MEILCGETGKAILPSDTAFAAGRENSNSFCPLSQEALDKVPHELRGAKRRDDKTKGINIYRTAWVTKNGETNQHYSEEDDFMFSLPDKTFKALLPKTSGHFI